MLDLQILQILNDVRKAMRQYVYHKDLQVRPVPLDRFQIDKKMEMSIEREVVLPIKKKNHNVLHSYIPMDNKNNYKANFDWGMELVLYDTTDDKQELSFYLIYTPRDDRIMYYVGNGEWYLSVGQRIDAVPYPKFPSAMGSYLGEYNKSWEFIKILKDSNESQKIWDFISTGSIFTDAMNLLCGRTCCMFSLLHDDKEDLISKLLIESGFSVYGINDVRITFNVNAKDIGESEEE